MRKLLWQNIVSSDEAFHAARTNVTAQYSFTEHMHDFAEVFWVSSGSGLHLINGSVQQLKRGDLIWIRPQDIHSFRSGPLRSCQITNIAFSMETMRHLGDRYYAGRTGALWQGGEFPETLHLEDGQLARFETWADELAQSPRQQLPLERFLLNMLYECYERAGRQYPDAMPDWLARACRAMEKPEHLIQGTEGFFKLTGYSREHVARTLRQHLDTTPTAMVNQLRMRHAARLLEMSDLVILEVAARCGIPNLSHFYDLFRAEHGVTPRQYRREHRRVL